jgi:sugar lactone lactonase YvrE
MPGGGDGITVDHEGVLYLAAPGGIWLYTLDGKLLAKILLFEKTNNWVLSVMTVIFTLPPPLIMSRL